MLEDCLPYTMGPIITAQLARNSADAMDHLIGTSHLLASYSLVTDKETEAFARKKER